MFNIIIFLCLFFAAIAGWSAYAKFHAPEIQTKLVCIDTYEYRKYDDGMLEPVQRQVSKFSWERSRCSKK